MFDIENVGVEIDECNRVRLKADLPLISVADELRWLYEAEQDNEFEQFFQTSPLRTRVEQKLLNRLRRLGNDPQWKPTGFLSGGGIGLYSQTRRVMRRVWRLQRMAT